jgi:hypothetical protein
MIRSVYIWQSHGSCVRNELTRSIVKLTEIFGLEAPHRILSGNLPKQPYMAQEFFDVGLRFAVSFEVLQDRL